MPSQPKRFYFLGSFEDKPYLQYLGILLKGHKVFQSTENPDTVAEVAFKCARHKLDAIICTSEVFLNKLINQGERAKISDFAGSIVDLSFSGIPIIECLFINPLSQLYSLRHGQFITKRFLSKLTAPENWNDPLQDFTFNVAEPDILERFYSKLDSATFLSIDIETLRTNISISCVGYTAVFPDFSHDTLVVPFDSTFNLSYIRKINEHHIPKLFQNGLYDNCYFLRFGAPVVNWRYDTLHLFHSWYSELPKKLGFITSFLLRKWPFWKDLAKTNDLEVYYEYNARDSFGTAAAWIQLLRAAPDWAIKNYTEFEFPMVFPSLYCQMEGWRIDPVEFKRLGDKEAKRLEKENQELAVMTHTPGFNANSPKQVKQLLTLLGIPKVESTDEKHLNKYKHGSPLIGRFVEKIIEHREAKKALSTYFDEDKLWLGKGNSSENPRFLYGLNPAFTDTGRLASREHPFWTGGNIQNIPEYAKGAFISDDGYELGEPDYSQSEARAVAYESQDQNLIRTVESGKDYHAVNVERFFGIAYEQVITPDGKILDKPLRDLSKRVNHGANYNMGWSVLIDTMGIAKVIEAGRILKLPKGFSLKQIAQHLLDNYAKAYPRVKTVWYDEIKYAVESNQMLISSLGWTRYCFGHPAKSKSDLNAYVAHVPQNLSVQIINKGFYKALAFQKANWPNFRIKAQIHDSTPFQFKSGREDLAFQYAKLLDLPVLIKGRVMRIPVDVKLSGKSWGERK